MSEEVNDNQAIEPVRCSQCGNPAFANMNGVILCLDCCTKVEYINQLQISRQVDSYNFLSALSDASRGFGISPKINNFRPLPPSGMLILNNISVDRSNIGTINTGTIQGLDNAITIIKEQNQTEVADGLEKLTEAVIKSIELSEDSRQEIVESLSFLADQISSPKQERKTTITKTLLERIPTLLQVASGLITLWKQFEPLIEAALKK